MERQTSFVQAEYAGKKKTTRRERFLGEMEQVVPWARLAALVTPFYPKGERGRPPMGVERMLRVYFLQQWYALADEALEDTLYDSQALRAFAGIDLTVDAVPDATTLLNFRHLLERHGLTKRLLEEVSTLLTERGVLLRAGTMVDATIIAAPSSTKNASHRRDSEMHQTKKGNVWHFGLKAHIGCDVASGVVHSLIVTAANVADVVCTPALLHGQEQSVFGDAGYTGADKRVAMRESKLRWQIALKRGWLEADEGWAAQSHDQGVGEAQSTGTRQGRASLPRREEPLRTPQDALPGPGQERRATAHALCLGQLSVSQTYAVGGNRRVSRRKHLKSPCKGARQTTTKRALCLACIAEAA